MPGELERRIVTVLFCDLAGFTSLSERLDAEDVAIVQGAYFDAVRDAVARHGGTLEKFIGDAVVAVYGVPVAREDDSERAVRTGLAIVGAVEQLSAGLALEDGALHVRVGVQSGGAVVHPSPLPGEAMVTGDVVNTAARLQAAAPVGAVLLGRGAALAVASSVELEDAGRLALKGKAEPVATYRAVAALPEPERERAMGELRSRTVGRDRELDLLRKALQDCARGRARRVTVVAPPGTGKSRLLQELARSAADAGADVRGARVRPDALAAFRPVADLVAAALAESGLEADDHDALRHGLEGRLGGERVEVVVEELNALLSGSGDAATAGEADARRAARFGAWSEGLGALGAGTEVWLVEDIHWATPDFRAFVNLAATVDGARGRLVVCTARPSLLEVDGDWVSGGDLVALDPLSNATTGELVRALVGDALADDVVRRIADCSDGNPLFVEELLRSWVSTGLLERHDGGWALRDSVAEIELPATVQAIYAAQLDDLPAPARLVVRRASVAGRQFAVAALGPLESSDPAGLGTLQRRGIVRGPISDRVLGESYVFRHALLRDVGYASLSRAERARLHVRMARWLEALGEERAPEVAEVTGRHYAAALDAAPTLAGDVGDGLARSDAAGLAAGWFERAGRDAVAASANEAARGLFERSLELTSDDDPFSRARRLVGLAQAVAFTSDMDAGLEAAREALSLFRGLAAGGGSEGAREHVSRAAALVGTILTQQLRFADAVDLAGDVLAELGERDDAATVRLLLVRIRGAGMIGDEAWDGTAADRARALELSQALGDPELELEARVCTVWDEADLRAAWADIERLASDLRRWPEVAEARRARAALCLPDDLEGALQGAARLLAFAQAHQLDELEAWAHYYATEAEFARGDWSAALASGVAAIDLAEAGSYHRAAARTWFAVVPVAAARADRALLRRAAEWYERLASFPDSPYGRISRSAVDILLAAGGLPSTFRVELASLGPSIAEGTTLPSWYEALDVVSADALAAGQVDEARRALGWFEEALARSPSAAGEATCTLLRARTLLAADGDVGAVRRCSRALAAYGAPWPHLKCLRLLLDSGAADAGEVAEAGELEARLGIPARAERGSSSR